jgi:hypothetical protein
MFYSHIIDVEPGIPRDEPGVYEIPLKEKWIEDIWIGFEDGCGWTVGVRIYYGIRRYFPENPDGWIYGNEVYVPIKQIVQLPERMESIKVYYHSEFARYSHSIYVLVWTSEEEIKKPEISLAEMLQYWKRIL